MTDNSSILHGRQKILIVEESQSQFGLKLKQYLRTFDNDIFLSPRIPLSIAQFDYCFFINEEAFLRKAGYFEHWKNVVLVIENNLKKAADASKRIHLKKLKGVKVVAIPHLQSCSHSQVEETVWFALSKSAEVLFTLRPETNQTTHTRPMVKQLKVHPPFLYRLYLYIEKTISKKNVTLFAIITVLIYHFMFVIPLLYGGAVLYQAVKKIQAKDFSSAVVLIHESQPPVAIAKQLYSLARPTFLLFSLAQTTDDLFAAHEKTVLIMNISVDIQNNAHQAFTLLLKKNKSDKEKLKTSSLIKSIKDSLSALEENLIFLNQKIPSRILFFSKYKGQMADAINMVAKAKKLSFYLPTILAQGGEKKYLLLFANNMELRPGGGFIGSYGILTMKDLTFEGIQVYDVYDADGQLTAHVKPPDPIRDYLSQPHWFLRDSAFSPDFYENYFQAKFFLDKERQLSDFSGGILITTTAIKNILYAFGNLYLPDFNEKVNADNFYLKTQLYAEKGFFPGSTQKKSFLSALTRQILTSLDSIPELELIKQVYKSAEEKQLVFYIENEDLQKVIDSYYWAGRIIEPHCPPNIDNCYTDFLFPYDANLGVNKANFFMNRAMEVKINIDSEGIVHSYLNIKFKNESIQDIFPGGSYQNYFQILIPRDSLVKRIMIDDRQLDQYDQDMGQFKKIGFFFDVPIQSKKEVSIEYQSIKKFLPGKSIYQFLLQKQIGSINNDVNLEITLPPNMFLVNQNFSALVKNNQILYNTELSADKIFFIELLKD
ncbi:DUF4012 domain-containing protein [Candidatus Roizmanbacteria bacterium]|nr:DUF4012 domain-containing protein [Candidatus Roizmanbacteria bacterium]